VTSDPRSLLAEIEKNSSDTRQLAALLQVLLMVPFHDPDTAYVYWSRREEEEREGENEGERQRGKGEGKGR
jgi:hypothetical protein